MRSISPNYPPDLYTLQLPVRTFMQTTLNTNKIYEKNIYLSKFIYLWDNVNNFN